MIKLEVEPYCHKCGDFEAHVVKTLAQDISGNYVVYDSIVRCEYYERCKKIANFIKEAEKNDVQREIHDRQSRI